MADYSVTILLPYPCNKNWFFIIFRYSPYPIPTVSAGAAAAAAAAAAGAAAANNQAAQGGAASAGAPGSAMGAAGPQVTASPYQGYNLTNVDMSSFQGVDWGAMYGVGMYV